MRLERLQVSELRQFRAPFELSGLQSGLNIFTGANEAGKSTLVRALRAAFLERHRSTSVDDLRPYGDSTATPSIELDFEIAHTPYRLTKGFLHKKRCELLVGTRRLEGVEAEDHLAQTLGFEFASRGASKNEHWGIPGLLWIEQGAAQAVREAVGHAGDHLRSALDESLGDVASSGGDEIVAKVRSLREELLTGTGKPRAAYLQSIEAAQVLAAQVSALQASIQTYRDQVDQLSRLRVAHLADTRDPPWVRLRDQLVQAQAALVAADSLASERASELEKLTRISNLKDLLLQQLAAAEQQQQNLARRESELLAAHERHDPCAALEQQSMAADAAASLRLQEAQAALRLARQEDNRTLLSRRLAEAQARVAEVTALLGRVTAEHGRAAALKREAARLCIDPKDLKLLRKHDQRLNELAISQAAVATRLRFGLEGNASVQVAGEAVAGNAERLLLAPTMISIPGIGTIHISPGGKDLAELAHEHSELQGKFTALLQRLGLASLAQAQALDLSYSQKIAQAEAAENALTLLAPRGLEALHQDLDAAQARQTEAASAIAQLPPAPDAAVLPLDEAEREHEARRQTADAARTALQQAGHALATAVSQRLVALRERDLLKSALSDPEQLSQLADKRMRLLEAITQEEAIKTAVEAIEARIAAARPDILKQDVERLQRSADEIHNQYHSRDRQIVQLVASLGAANAQGLEEELGRQQSALTLANKRRDELQRRAQALAFLLGQLESRRQALTRRLQAPLQKHLDHYLKLLFPTGQLSVNENLVPGALTRPGVRGLEACDFETLSFGAREQMGVISRLAYADLLKEAGRPTLVILDDALVHSDEHRLTQMKRVLFDAAQRHQVLLFTCHPFRWRDMGVPLRGLEDERLKG